MATGQKRLIMIGNSHIDPVWLWREDEGLQEVKATFASALQRMQEFPEFQFTASSAAFYAWLREHHPLLFEQIKQRVAEGRWHLAGGWWVEPDVNLASGESLVRQGLYGQRFFLEHFGKTARVCFNVDSFGHAAGLPEILAGQRLMGYVFMRPNPDQWQLPGVLFRWVDAGGAGVTACRISGEYCAWTKVSILDNMNKTLQAMAAQGLDCLPCYYGVGNHGGGPTIENIKAIREIALEKADLDIRNGSLDECLDAWQGLSLPRVAGELEGCFPGCYSADSQIKALNRQAEEALARAETLCALATGFTFAYPVEALREAWQTLLFQQFHDTLAGTARKEARDEAALALSACLHAARVADGAAMQAIAAGIDTRGEGLPLLLVNPCAVPFQGVVDADISWRTKHPLRLKDPLGYETLYDTSARGLVAPDARLHLVFRASLPPLGYGVYRLLQEKPLIEGTRMASSAAHLENELLRVDLQEGGGITGIRIKANDLQILSEGLSLVVYEDKRDTWGAQGAIGEALGSYRCLGTVLEEEGRVRASLRIDYAFHDSNAALTLSLGQGEPFLTLRGSLDNREKLALTVLRLPLAALPGRLIAESPYGEQVRSCVEAGEQTCQRYCDLQGEGLSVLLINQAKYAYRFHRGAFELVLSRSPIHAFGSGEQVKAGRSYAYIDQGELPFSLRVLPRLGAFTQEERVMAAQQFHRPPAILLSDIHEGPSALREASLAQLQGTQGLVLHQLKQAEDGGIAARLQNTGDQQALGSLRFRQTLAPICLAAQRLGSLILTPGEGGRMADLLELPLPAEEEERNKVEENEKK
ncbi:MAG: glycoside hydrolase family 38 C-terminal domain-containing protein [Christensenellales bacterium]